MRLRRFVPADLEELHTLHNDPEVMRFLTGGTPVSREEIRHGYLEEPFLDDHAAAIEGTTGEFLGWFGMHPAVDGHPGVEDDAPGDFWLGYRLRVSAWGRGLATEGSRALVERAFTVPDAGRVRATTMAVNTRSRRVMERAGLSYVSTYHLEWDDPLPGTEQGEVLYEVTRGEWERRRPEAS